MHSQIKIFKAAITAVVRIQSLERKRFAKIVVAKLRDPYCFMSNRDLKLLLRSEVASMEKAIDEKDFVKAASMEERM